jgi:hypothetical protein
MRIAQFAPLTEAVPPRLYGGTERVVHWSRACGDEQRFINTNSRALALWGRGQRRHPAIRPRGGAAWKRS